MKRSRCWAWLAMALGMGLAGCVERRFVITTEPFGAIAYDEKGQPMGATPVDRQFTYYGKYRFTLVRDGCQTLVVEENVKAPWYEYPPLDFISENLIPWKIVDIRRFAYQLPPAQIVSPEAVLGPAGVLRERGKNEGVPLPPGSAPVPAPGMPPVNLAPPQPLMTPVR